MFEELIKNAIQTKLMDILNLNIGRTYKLPSCAVINYPEVYPKEVFTDLFLKKNFWDTII